MSARGLEREAGGKGVNGESGTAEGLKKCRRVFFEARATRRSHAKSFEHGRHRDCLDTAGSFSLSSSSFFFFILFLFVILFIFFT